MSRLKRVSPHIKKILLSISIFLVALGFIPQLVIGIDRDLHNPYTVEHLALESEDGTYISSFIYTPKGEKNHGGILLAHRYWGDKALMEPLSIELVRRGFTVINIDLRGHGASGGQFIQSKLVSDLKAAVDYFESEIPYITQIGVVGHSLGATAVTELASTYPHRINATVAIGSLNFNPVGIRNLLMAIGRYDQVFFERELLNSLRLYTGEENVSIGQLYYGDFVGGNNTMAFVGSYFDHLLEVIDPTIMYQTIQWFEQAFNGAMANDVILTEWFLEVFSLLGQFGDIFLIFILIVYISRLIFKIKVDHQDRKLIKDSKTNSKSLISYYAFLIMGFAVVLFFFLLPAPRNIEQLNTTTSILYIGIGAAIGGFLLYPFVIMSNEGYFSVNSYYLRLKLLTSNGSKRAVLFGIASALLSVLVLSVFWDFPSLNYFNFVDIFVILITLMLISSPLFLVKEFYFRTIQEKLKKKKIYIEYLKIVFTGLLMDNLIIFPIFCLGWPNFFYLPSSLPYLTVWIKFSFIYNLLVSWVYIYSGRNILGSTIFSSILYTWLVVIIFPSFGFI